jgi:Mg-chelatase subunit ChlD
MSKGKTVEIVCILDRSGSMETIIDDSIGGFNAFLKEQKNLPGKAKLSVVLFDDQYEKLYDRIKIKDAEELTSETYVPRGMTALYDAIGKTITSMKVKDSKPVVIAILTDGEENASKEYTIEQINKLIKEKRDLGWEFVFLAANQDAFAVGGKMGIDAGSTFSYVADGAGTRKVYDNMTNSVKLYRSKVSKQG